MSVTEIKDRPGYFLVVVYDRVHEPGARPRKTQRIVRGQRAAEKVERDLLRDRDRGSLAARAQTLADFADRYLASRRAEVSASTLDGYQRIVDRYIDPYIGHLRLEAVDRTAVAGFYSDVLEHGSRRRGVPIEPATVQSIARVLSMILKRAREDGLIHRSPCDVVKPPKDDRAREDDEPGIDPETARQFLAYAAGTQVGVVAAVALGTGLRRGELMALRWQDVDMEAGEIDVNGAIEEVGGHAERKAPKTRRSRRKVPFGPAVADVLRRQRALLAEKKLQYAKDGAWVDQGWVFPTQRVAAAHGGDLLPAGRLWTPGAFSQRWKRLMNDVNGRRLGEFVLEREPIASDDELAKVVAAFEPWDFGIHALRHAYATSQLAAGIRDEVVSRRMGHADSYITRRVYSHVTRSEDRTGVDVADALLPNAQPDRGGHRE